MAPGRGVRQVLLLCALALAVVGMHHVALAPHETAHETPSVAVHAAAAMPMDLLAAQPSDGSGTGAGHDME